MYPVETREVLTAVELAGQFVTLAAQLVTVTSWVLYRVSVSGVATGTGTDELTGAAGVL